MWKNGCAAVGDTEMFYVSFGRGRKNLVVLPGLSDGLATVKGKAAILSVSYRRFFSDYTVYLFSRKNRMPEGYSIREMARDQATVLKSLGIERAYVLGVSLGGMIAQYLAIDYPELVEKLILAVTAPNANPIVTAAVSGWIGMAERGEHTALIVDTAEKTYSEAYFQKSRKLFPLLAAITRPKSYERFLRNAQAILRFDSRGELARIACPTLIIAGSSDRTLGKDACFALKAAISDSALFIYDGLGHAVYEEAKDFYDRVLAFCNQE